MSRTSDPDIKRKIEALYSSTQGKESNLKNIASFEQTLQDVIKPFLNKYSPQQVKAILADKDIALPDSYLRSGSAQPKVDLLQQAAPSNVIPTKKTKTAIKLDDGTIIPDTPENRKKYGL